jgi:2-methylcitrate dehydratase PrpD
VLEGANGLYAALAGGRGDPAAVVTDLGRRWETTRIGLKPYPACQLVHSTLDAGARAIAAGPLAVDDVAAVRVFVHPDSAPIVCGPGKAEPRTAYDAKFSLPWSLAALLVDGTVTPATYGADSLARPHLRTLAARVVVVVTEPDGVAADAPGRVEVDLAGGGRLVGTVERSAGGPDNPLDDLAFDDKLAGNVGSADAAARLTKAVHAAVPVSELVALVDELAHPEEDR